VVRRDDDRLDALRAATFVFDRDLRLSVRAEERKRAVLTGEREPARQPVRERDGERHQLRGLAAGEADHHPLVPRPLQLERVIFERSLALFERVVDTRRDVGGLLLQVDLDQRVVGVETALFVVVADVADRVPDRPLNIKLGVGCDLTDHHTQTLRDRGLTRDAGMRILREHSIEDGV
jgi:hypothetical protein